MRCREATENPNLSPWTERTASWGEGACDGGEGAYGVCVVGRTFIARYPAFALRLREMPPTAPLPT